MIARHHKELKAVEKTAIEMGMKLVRGSDFSVVFATEGGWEISFEVERYHRSLFDLTITPPDGQGEFSIWLLMKVYSSTNNVDMPIPTLANQLNFLQNEFNGWLCNIYNYKSVYQSFNETQ